MNFDMWSRLIRALTALLNMYSFYSNPVRYILSLLMIIVIPYLVYIFWGTVVIFLLVGVGIYVIYRMVRSKKGNSYHY